MDQLGQECVSSELKLRRKKQSEINRFHVNFNNCILKSKHHPLV